MPAPPHTVFPQPSAPAAKPPPERLSSARGVCQAGIARLAEVVRLRHEAHEEAMMLDELLAAEDAEVEINDERTWADRHASARALRLKLNVAWALPLRVLSGPLVPSQHVICPCT